MAEEVEMTPVEMTPVDATPSAPPIVNPITRRPVVGTATQTGLKPGLKLPPKPGATVALKPGLKLPPKPGATVALKPAGTQTALKPGLRLPPKPVIHKPGTTVAAKPLPKPVGAPAAAAAPAASATPAAPAAPTPVPVDAQGVGKLPTVAAKAIARDDVKPAVSENQKPMEALKSVTQKLKGITQQIPQQAILRKTGIIADAAMTDAQKQAAKSKTARISLSDAMGVAPVKNENAPMKTIRIKRPVSIPGATESKLSPVAPKATTAEAAPEAAPTSPTAPASTDAGASVTQRKTLKISRPGGGAVRPTGKFGIKRPATQASTAVKPAADGENPPATEGAVADILDIPNIPEMPVAAAEPVSDGPAWLWTLSALVQVAACAVMGALAWFLYENTTTQYF